MANSVPSFINIAAYRFVTLDRLKHRRVELLQECKSLDLKGTILLSQEGINLFLAGQRDAIDAFLDHLRSQPEFADIPAKESESDHQPFNRMLVKIKREIISFGIDQIDPRQETSPRISPRELKQWLDEGRPVTLLDVRNDYEVKVGTFHDALTLPIDDFRGFPQAVDHLSLPDQPIVTFCTGGIRCEKAAPFLEQQGIGQVFQLDGGILKYFEDCGGDHYDGECFVFDKRVSLDPGLSETETGLCFACHAVLSADDQLSPHYIEGQSCPHCHVPDETLQQINLQERQAAICKVADPLPGSQPYENHRPLRVAQRFDGMTVIEFLTAIRTHFTPAQWDVEIRERRLLCGGQPVSTYERVSVGQHLVHVMPGTVEPDVAANVTVLFEDDAILVVQKPAPLPMHACGRFHRNTLQYILDEAFAPWHVRAAHRLDANTSGVVVLSKTRHIAARVQSQFQRGEVQKQYRARIQGRLPASRIECNVPISREPDSCGARLPDPDGLPAQTQCESLRTFDDETSLIQVTPRTGRTNQIRIHLWDLNVPVCGDPLYLPDRQLGSQQTLEVKAPPMCLHAFRIGLTHPVSQHWVEFQAELPDWAE